MIGVDPSVFRRFVKEETEAVGADEDMNEFHDRRCEVKDYKMPRRKTTRRKKQPDKEFSDRLV